MTSAVPNDILQQILLSNFRFCSIMYVYISKWKCVELFKARRETTRDWLVLTCLCNTACADYYQQNAILFDEVNLVPHQG
jgi:hypothetical protein